jgi:hypothetical protein
MLSSFARRRGVLGTAASTALFLAALAALLAAPSPAHADGIFVAECDFSHRAGNDPIVHPRMPRMSHSHDFFGNLSTDAFSTTRSLRASTGTCLPAGDESAYWVPTLYKGARALTPTSASAYYQDFFRKGRALPFPAGLRVVAGNAGAKKPQRGVVRWTCEGEHGQGIPTIPDCGSARVTLRVAFPDCWDGRRLDSPNHKSHMAYNNADGLEPGLQECPASHPIAVPQLQLNVTYPMHDGKGVELASGSPVTAHADFFNAWKPAALRRRINRVLNRGRACHPLLGCIDLTDRLPSDYMWNVNMRSASMRA